MLDGSRVIVSNRCLGFEDSTCINSAESASKDFMRVAIRNKIPGSRLIGVQVIVIEGGQCGISVAGIECDIYVIPPEFFQMVEDVVRPGTN